MIKYFLILSRVVEMMIELYSSFIQWILYIHDSHLMIPYFLGLIVHLISQHLFFIWNRVYAKAVWFSRCLIVGVNMKKISGKLCKFEPTNTKWVEEFPKCFKLLINARWHSFFEKSRAIMLKWPSLFPRVIMVHP